jgi:hypothetical protein
LPGPCQATLVAHPCASKRNWMDAQPSQELNIEHCVSSGDSSNASLPDEYSLLTPRQSASRRAAQSDVSSATAAGSAAAPAVPDEAEATAVSRAPAAPPFAWICGTESLTRPQDDPRSSNVLVASARRKDVRRRLITIRVSSPIHARAAQADGGDALFAALQSANRPQPRRATVSVCSPAN